VPADADCLTSGTLQSLRDLYGIGFRNNPFSNSIQDEQDITNFRIISDYMTSLLQTWINNRKFFEIDAKDAFFGTQLVLISRQLSVIVETVNEVRFALNSVFIGPSERQTLQLKFFDSSLPSMFLEDVLVEVEDFAATEGPALVQNGGRLSVRNNILPVVGSLDKLVRGARKPKNVRELPKGYKTIRVQNTLADLSRQLGELIRLTKPVGRDVPSPEGGVFALPPTVDFGSVASNQSGVGVGSSAGNTLTTTASAVQVVSLVNLGDTRIATITAAISVAPGAANPFAATTNQFPSPDTASSLGAAKTASVTVTFTPPTVGAFSGELVITDDTDTELVRVPLQGKGI
jgi:hypothetical protein